MADYADEFLQTKPARRRSALLRFARRPCDCVWPERACAARAVEARGTGRSVHMPLAVPVDPNPGEAGSMASRRLFVGARREQGRRRRAEAAADRDRDPAASAKSPRTRPVAPDPERSNLESSMFLSVREETE